MSRPGSSGAKPHHKSHTYHSELTHGTNQRVSAEKGRESKHDLAAARLGTKRWHPRVPLSRCLNYGRAMRQEEEDGAQAGPLPSPSPGPVYLANFQAQGPGNLPGEPFGQGRAGAPSSSSWRRFAREIKVPDPV